MACVACVWRVILKCVLWVLEMMCGVCVACNIKVCIVGIGDDVWCCVWRVCGVHSLSACCGCVPGYVITTIVFK